MTEIGMVGVFDPNLDSVLALADNGFFQLTWNQVPQVTDISGTFPVQVNKGELDRKISIECMLNYAILYTFQEISIDNLNGNILKIPFDDAASGSQTVFFTIKFTFAEGSGKKRFLKTKV